MIDNIFGIAGMALNAQLTRMNATASNLANAGSVASSPEEAFKAKRPLFKTVIQGMTDFTPGRLSEQPGGVRVERLVDDPAPTRKQYDPSSPVADKDGFVHQSNVNEVSEMVEMMAAARAYQNNVETVNTARQLMSRTLDLLRS